MRRRPPWQLVVALVLGGGCDEGRVASPLPHEPAQREPVPRAAAPAPAAAAARPDPPAEGPTAPARPEPKAERLALTFVGDVIFGRYRDGGFVPIVADPGFDPFAEIRPVLAADVVVGNLETPVVEQLPAASPLSTPYRFGGSRAMVRDWLGDFTVLGLANNHALDLGDDGQRQSPAILASEGIVPIGASRLEAPSLRVETHVARGWRIAFIAVTTLLNVPDPPGGPQVPFVAQDDAIDVLVPLVASAREGHDLVVVFVHWGDEYFAAPSPAQQRVAHALVDGGADMVIGHHPHVLQGIERHGSGLVAYSLGNFLFEHTTSVPRLMGVLRTTWEGADAAGPSGAPRLVDAVVHAAVGVRAPHPHPAPARGRLAEAVRERLVRLGLRLGTRWRRIPGTEDLRLVRLGPAPASYGARSTSTR